MRREAMNNSSSLCSAAQWAVHPGRADRALQNAARARGRGSQSGERQGTDGRAASVLWADLVDLVRPLLLVQLGHHAGRRRAAGRQAPLRYSTMQNLRPYHHHRVLHAVNTIIITDKIGPHARTLPPSAPLSLRLLTKISDSVGGDGDFLLCSVTGEGTTVAEVEVS